MNTHPLLKGIPPDELMESILRGHSMRINSREHRFISSAIVAGCLPIALGVAMAGQTAWCFVGDMAAMTGTFREVTAYAQAYKLPLHVVVEDNNRSVSTPTDTVWGRIDWLPHLHTWPNGGIIYYKYIPTYPHAGVGKHVKF